MVLSWCHVQVVPRSQPMTLSLKVRPTLEARVSFILDQHSADELADVAGKMRCTRAEVMRALVAEFLQQKQVGR